MSSKARSPAARMLRGSRAFSLPPPLLRPEPEGYTLNRILTPSSTDLYPSQQAIVTTPSGQAIGDWGLKRPLPSRILKRTTHPVVRINAMDTREFITDYTSAGNHTLNLQKLEELQLAVTTAATAKRSTPGLAKDRVSVFESSVDNALKSVSDQDPSINRWKFKGPWLSSMEAHQFQSYVKKGIGKRRQEFDAFMREHIRQQLLLANYKKRLDVEQSKDTEQNQRKEARVVGQEIRAKPDTLGNAVNSKTKPPTRLAASPADVAAQIQARMEAMTQASSDNDRVGEESSSYDELVDSMLANAGPSGPTGSPLPTVENVTIDIRKEDEPSTAEIDSQVYKFRNDFSLHSKLGVLIARFLDLPSAAKTGISLLDINKDTKFFEKGPPMTHPSAGLVYSMTDALIDNHPLYGPQRTRRIVQGRILTGQYSTAKANGSKIGIAGVVAKEPAGKSKVRAVPVEDDGNDSADADSNGLGIKTKGGNRIWAHPRQLSIDNGGRVDILADNPELALARMYKGEDLVYHSSSAGTGTTDGRVTGYDIKSKSQRENSMARPDVTTNPLSRIYARSGLDGDAVGARRAF